MLVVLLPLLLLLPITPLAGAQGSTVPERWAIQVQPEQSAVSVDYLGAANVKIEIRDISLTASTGQNPLPNRVRLDAEVLGNDTAGWVASVGPPSVNTRPGEVNSATLTVSPDATIDNPEVQVRITAEYVPRYGTGGYVTNTTVYVRAEPNPVVVMQYRDAVPEFRPDQRKQIPVEVTNADYYPEMISFEARAPEGWVISPPSSIQLAPGETRTVLLDVKAPQDPWFRLNPSSPVITLTAETQTNAGGQFSTPIPAPISGWFLPGWVIPHLALLALGVAVVGKRTVSKAREHRLEKGKPRFPGLPPEKEARFEALKREDPERADQMKTRLKELHKKRVAAWKEDFKDRKRNERERRKQAKKRHDAILEKKRKEAKRKRQAEKRKRKEMKKKQKKREKLLKKRRKLEERKQKAKAEREAELAKEMRQQREERAAETGQSVEAKAPDDEDVREEGLEARKRKLEALKKKKRLEELRRKKQALEEDADEETDG